MNSLILILIASGLFELGLTIKPLWPIRFYCGWLIFLVILVVTVWLLFIDSNKLWILILVFIAIYRLFNLYRMIYSPAQHDHLRHITNLTSFRLWLFQLGIILFGYILTNSVLMHKQQWILLTIINLALALVLLTTIKRQQKIARRIGDCTALVDRDLPTLTVAIPARNETDTLNECLISVLASDYPKLEVMVLDDQSTIKRTSEIIRSFAHEGVLFIAGQKLEKGWLAKNWAYQQLLESANGDIILFCGADTRFSQQSLRFLISSLVSRQKSVISILPKNNLPSTIYGGLFQPLRYAWEIALPRRGLHRPPVLSTCWLASRKYIKSKGGFRAVANRVVAESYFAKISIDNDGYSFFAYDGILSDKPLADLKETAIRLRYPQLRRQPELVALITLVELAGILTAWPLFIYGVISLNPLILLFGLMAILVFSYAFATIATITYRKRIILSYLIWPAYIVLDIYLLHVSMWRYEFGEVLWKGRSVTLPIKNAEKS